MRHLAEHHGLRTASQLARKHIPWYTKGMTGSGEFRNRFQRLSDWQQQMHAAEAFFVACEHELADAA
jgi:tRNA-dihydrouridine synthase B